MLMIMKAVVVGVAATAVVILRNDYSNLNTCSQVDVHIQRRSIILEIMIKKSIYKNQNVRPENNKCEDIPRTVY